MVKGLKRKRQQPRRTRKQRVHREGRDEVVRRDVVDRREAEGEAVVGMGGGVRVVWWTEH